MKKGQTFVYVGVILFISVIILLVLPIIQQQKITFTLRDGEIEDLKFIEVRETGAGIILEHFKTKEIAGTKVNITVYTKSLEKCLYQSKPYNLKCVASLNETVWTTPTAKIEVKTQLPQSEYVARVISFVYESSISQMKEKSREDFSFKVE